jgi:putative oxidoreductase
VYEYEYVYEYVVKPPAARSHQSGKRHRCSEDLAMNRIVTVVRTLNAFAARVGGLLSFLPPLVVRLGVGLVFVQSGWGKLHNLSQVTEFFAELGLPAPAAQALFVSSTELVCGALVMAGLATRYAAVPLMITMLVALRTALWDQLESVSSIFGLIEGLYAVIFAWLAIAGPGAVSADALLERTADDDAVSPVGRLASRTA